MGAGRVIRGEKLLIVANCGLYLCRGGKVRADALLINFIHLRALFVPIIISQNGLARRLALGEQGLPVFIIVTDSRGQSRDHSPMTERSFRRPFQKVVGCAARNITRLAGDFRV